MLYTINNYGTILDNYAYPQGDIAMAMNESAEVRAASRGIVGYDSDSLIESMKEQHEQAVKSFEEYLEKIRPTMITKEGTACMDAIDKAWAEYKEVDAKVIEVGATTDTAKSLQAQQMMTDEAAPKYQALDDALQKLMSLNISLGNAKRAQLRTVMIAALTIIIIVIAVSTIYSNSLSVAISKSIEKPLNELKDRFITFAEGDIDSPLPTVESEDEIKELVSAMSDRIRVIIKDSGRMLNEMSEGNFAIDTECEEVYTGAFTDLLTGIRKMNEEIDTTVRGVDDASGQVLTGSTNLAEAAQSLAEGATDQAASVEEMQATINELTSGIKTTAEELGTAYDEAYKYAEIAEGSRGDMEVLVQAMSRINETSEKIGAIITQIEDIASQTNLLSLNASIEAARAGEAGKGFAVVADQIRNLAEQSAKSAVDSKALIEAAIHEVGDGNMYAEKASTSLREVVDGIQAIADSAKKIKEISIEQADSMEQVEATAERIAEVVQNNSAAAQETSATSEELTAQATTLSGMVSVFKLRQ
jgi:methyl-accepting chemotaxis protein